MEGHEAGEGCWAEVADAVTGDMQNAYLNQDPRVRRSNMGVFPPAQGFSFHSKLFISGFTVCT